jgi:hypothetical protein
VTVERQKIEWEREKRCWEKRAECVLCFPLGSGRWAALASPRRLTFDIFVSCSITRFCSLRFYLHSCAAADLLHLLLEDPPPLQLRSPRFTLIARIEFVRLVRYVLQFGLEFVVFYWSSISCGCAWSMFDACTLMSCQCALQFCLHTDEDTRLLACISIAEPYAFISGKEVWCVRCRGAAVKREVVKMASRAEAHAQKPNSPNDVLIDLGHPLVNHSWRLHQGWRGETNGFGVQWYLMLQLRLTCMLVSLPCSVFMKKGRLNISAVEIQCVEGRIRVCGGDGEQVGAIQAGAQDAVRSLFSGDHVPSTCTRKSSSFGNRP